jgi:hypothetical protein
MNKFKNFLLHKTRTAVKRVTVSSIIRFSHGTLATLKRTVLSADISDYQILVGLYVHPPHIHLYSFNGPCLFTSQFFCYLALLLAPGGVWTRLKTGSLTSSSSFLVQYATTKLSYGSSISISMCLLFFFILFLTHGYMLHS